MMFENPSSTPKSPVRVLFLCQHNAGRSLMAEAILNKIGTGRFLAYSAGITPSKTAHPYTLQVLAKEGFDTQNLQPKSIQQFLQPNAPKMDLVIGLCQSLQDNQQLNGIFPMTAHWHFDEVDHILGDSQIDQEHFSQIQRQLAQRLHLFISLSDEKISHLAKKTDIDQHLVNYIV